MAHVVLVHGIANKLAPDELEQGWLDSLRDNDGLDLRAEGVGTTMCYWADVLYESPLPPGGASMEAGEEADVATAADDVGVDWFDALPPDQRVALEELAAEADTLSVLLGDSDEDLSGEEHTDDATASGTESAGGFERLPLPGPLKRRLMRAFLRDVHHYLWDTPFTPRPNETYHVRTEVRRRLLHALRQLTDHPGPHVVIGHSLGSVIAYDVLKNVGNVPVIDHLITLGSPLGLDEVQDRLQPGWTRRDGYPRDRVRDGWFNAYDRLDPVCGFDPVLGNDFRDRGKALVVDTHAPSWGRWRHSIGKYLRGTQLRQDLATALRLQ